MQVQHKPKDIVWTLVGALDYATGKQRPLILYGELMAIENYIGGELTWKLYNNGIFYSAQDSLCFKSKEELITYLILEECQKDYVITKEN